MPPPPARPSGPRNTVPLVPPKDSAPSLSALVSSAEAEADADPPLPRRAVTQPFPAYVNKTEPGSATQVGGRRGGGPGLLGSMMAGNLGSTVNEVLRSTPASPPPAGFTLPGFEAPLPVPPPRMQRLSIVDRTSIPEPPPVPTPSRKREMLAVGVALAVVVGAFLAGRASSARAGGLERAHLGHASVASFSRARLADIGRRACLMQAAPSRWASKALRTVPVDVVPTPGGELAVGFARDEGVPRGLFLDPATGQVRLHEPEGTIDGLVRVAPLPAGSDVTFATIATEQEGLKVASYVRAERPMLFGVAGEELALVSEPGAAPKPLWKLPGPVERIQVVPIGPQASVGVGVAYLANERVWLGIAKLDGTVVKEPFALESESTVGRPMLASDGRELSVVYAEGVMGTSPVKLRWARVKADGSMPSEGKVPFVELPPGGPGGDAIAPDIAALPGNRWLLLWTEGSEGERALRAQTYDGQGVRLGTALRISPETGNFGQGTVAVIGDRAVVAFLLKSDSYQLWGSVLQCR
ncbi:MAG: hypothetical protein FJ096_06790 [Deltaproteobacteria bacterium]|nr:hypothetical protein [Deltaproteobacteria bacterium]